MNQILSIAVRKFLMNIGKALAGQIKIAGPVPEFAESLTETLRVFRTFEILDFAPERQLAAAIEIRLLPIGDPIGLLLERNTGLCEEGSGF